MPAIITRAVVPLLLLGAGITSLVYGVRFHTVPVTMPAPEAKEAERKACVPSGMPSFAGSRSSLGAAFSHGPGAPEANPAGTAGGSPNALLPWARPPEFSVPTEKQKKPVRSDQSEPTLVRDVTIGGVVLLESGELQRTYSGKAPSLCPT
jgi:hypothetical protein